MRMDGDSCSKRVKYRGGAREWRGRWSSGAVAGEPPPPAPHRPGAPQGLGEADLTKQNN